VLVVGCVWDECAVCVVRVLCVWYECAVCSSHEEYTNWNSYNLLLTVFIADFSQIEPTLQCTSGIVLTVAAESLQELRRV